MYYAKIHLFKKIIFQCNFELRLGFILIFTQTPHRLRLGTWSEIPEKSVYATVLFTLKRKLVLE